MSSLVDDNLDLVFITAKGLVGKHWEDYVTSGYIGLHDAASKFKTDGGAKFRSYARHRIAGAIRDQRRGDAGCRFFRKKPPPPTEQLHEFVSAQPLPDQVASTDEVRWMTEPLVAEDRMTAAMLIDGFTYGEIGRVVGVSASSIGGAIKKRIRPALSRRLKERAA